MENDFQWAVTALTGDNVAKVTIGDQTLGYIDVSKNKDDSEKKYRAVTVNGRIGLFSTVEEALEFVWGNHL